MSEDPAVYQTGKRGRNLTKFQAKRSIYLGICIDYLLGKSYSEIRRIYKVNNGYIQYALEVMGVDTNRIRSKPRFKTKRGRFSQRIKAKMREEKRIKRQRCCGSGGNIKKDNNPVLVDDMDVMERMDGTDNTDDPSCEINIDEEGEIFYDHND